MCAGDVGLLISEHVFIIGNSRQSSLFLVVIHVAGVGFGILHILRTVPTT